MSRATGGLVFWRLRKVCSATANDVAGRGWCANGASPCLGMCVGDVTRVCARVVVVVVVVVVRALSSSKSWVEAAGSCLDGTG